MHRLPRNEDPTGLLNLFRYEAAMRYGDPSGHIQGRGRWHHGRKKGPGRRYDTSQLTKAAKLRSELRKDAYTRNPFVVHEKPHPIYHGEMIRRVEQLPVRMKVHRLRRCTR